MTVEEKREAYRLFHKMWGAASGGEYHKADWDQFQFLIERVIYVPPDQAWDLRLVNDQQPNHK